MIASVPDFYQRFLHNILCILLVERDAEGKPEELVLHREYVGLETDILHLCSNWKTIIKGQKLHLPFYF